MTRSQFSYNDPFLLDFRLHLVTHQFKVYVNVKNASL